MQKYFTKKNLKNAFLVLFFVISSSFFLFSSNHLFKIIIYKSTNYVPDYPFTVFVLILSVAFFIWLYLSLNKNKKVLLFLVIILFFSIVNAFKPFTFSVKGILAEINFLVDYNRFMNIDEGYFFKKYNDPFLGDKSYCESIKGRWYKPRKPVPLFIFYSHPSEWCIPKTEDNGKICYDDRECQSYCEVDSINLNHGKCYEFLIDDRYRYKCKGAYYITNGVVREYSFCGW